MTTYEQAQAVQQQLSDILFKYKGFERIAISREYPAEGDYKVLVLANIPEPECSLPTEIDGVKIDYAWECVGPVTKEKEVA